MRILYVGDMNSSTNSFRIARALKELGHDVETISSVPYGRRVGITKDPSLLKRFRAKLGYPPDDTGVNERLIEKALEYQPDLIFLFKAMSVRPETLSEVKSETDAEVAFLSFDNMEKEHNQSSYFTSAIEYYDTVFMARGYSESFYIQNGAENVVEFDLGYDKRFLYPREPARPYRYDVTFIGTYERDRHTYIDALARCGHDVHVWGNGWKDVDPPENLHLKHRPVYEGAYVDAMHDSKIVLNFFREMNDDVMNSRTFEIPASCSCMVSESTAPEFEFFEDGREAVYVDSPNELIEAVKYYLQHDEERETIASAGYERCREDSYDYHSRLESMLAEI